MVAIQKMTVAEFRELEFDDNDTSWYELIDGELVKKHGPAFRSPNPFHQRISRKIEVALDTYVNQNKLGEIFDAPIDVFLDGYNAIQPDLLFVATADASIVTNNGVEGIPSLIVEIISPTSAYRDRVTKKKLYEQHGVPEYWLVDPQEELIEIFALTDGRYVLLSAATPDESQLQSNVLPDLVIYVADVLR